MTTHKWVLPFYKRQFEWLDRNLEECLQEDLNRQAAEVIEQAGKPVLSMLEIGAGIGALARHLDMRGISMTTLELVPELVAYSKGQSKDSIGIHQGDFYTYEFAQTFDVVGYFDGFGIGTDEEQLALLRRIRNWMTDDGCALIDIYKPEHWKKAAGQEMNLGAANRQYGFDEENCRMLDSWWAQGSSDSLVTQSLRCYSVGEISELCLQADLIISAIFPGGGMDYEKWVYHELAPLPECMMYRVKLKKR